MWRAPLVLISTLLLLGRAESSIFEAVAKNDATAVMNAVSGGEDINQKGPGGQTPLVNAILTGKPEAVKALLDLKADYTIPEKDGLASISST